MLNQRTFWQICAIPLGDDPEDASNPNLKIVYDDCVGLKTARELAKMTQKGRGDFVFVRRVNEQTIRTYEREAVAAAFG